MTSDRYEWMLAPSWRLAHRVDWESIEYVTAEQTQRATAVCGRRVKLHGKVLSGPSGARPCIDCQLPVAASPPGAETRHG